MQIYKDGFIDWIGTNDIITNNLEDIKWTNLILYHGHVEKERRLEWEIDTKTWIGTTVLIRNFKQFILVFKFNSKSDIFERGYRYELSDIFKMSEETYNKLNLLGANVDYDRFIKLLKYCKLSRLYNSNGLRRQG